MKKKLLLVGVLSFIFALAPVVRAEEELTSEAIFDKIAPNNVINVDAIKPLYIKENENYDSHENVYVYLKAYIYKNFPEKDISIDVSNCNDSLTNCSLKINYYTWYDEHMCNTDTTERNVELNWKTTDEGIKSKIDNYKKIASDTDITVSDLSLLSYLKNEPITYYYGSNNQIVYSNLVSKINDPHVSYLYLAGRGDDEPFVGISGGYLLFFYDGIIYGVIDTDVIEESILYIPEDTADTDEAVTAAIQKRIDGYFGANHGITVTKGSSISDYIAETEALLDLSKYGNKVHANYYALTVNGIERYFMILKDSSKFVAPKRELTDAKSSANVTISTTSTEVPTDTVVTVNTITEKTKEYEKIEKALKTNVFKAFDITLYSATTGGNITQLTNGNFVVTVPMGVEYLGKTLSAYYIKADGKLEEHPVTLDSLGNATFETNHFSTYIITEKIENEDALTISNAQTGDNIGFYAIMLGMGIGGVAIVFQKRQN